MHRAAAAVVVAALSCWALSQGGAVARAAAATDLPPLRVVLLQLEGAAIEPDVVAMLHDVLRAGLEATPGIEVVAGAEVKPLARCRNTACQVRWARKLHIGAVVRPRVGRLEASYLITVTTHDVAAEQERRFGDAVEATGGHALVGELRAAVLAALCELPAGRAVCASQQRTATTRVPDGPSQTGLIKSYEQYRALRQAKGIIESDLPPHLRQAEVDFERALGEGQTAAAAEHLQQLVTAVEQMRIDRAFVNGKMGRLARLRAATRPNSVISRELDLRFARLTQLYTDGRYIRANQEINAIVRLLRSVKAAPAPSAPAGEAIPPGP